MALLFSPFNPPLSYFLTLMTQENLSTWPVFLSQPKQRWGYMFFSLSTQGSLIISLSNTSDLQFPQSAMNTRRGRGWRCSISAATKLLRLSYPSSFPTLSICCYFQSQNLRGLERERVGAFTWSLSSLSTWLFKKWGKWKNANCTWDNKLVILIDCQLFNVLVYITIK